MIFSEELDIDTAVIEENKYIPNSKVRVSKTSQNSDNKEKPYEMTQYDSSEVHLIG